MIILVVLAYWIGHVAHVVAQADSIVRAQNNDMESRLEVIKANAARLAVRAVFAFAGFLLVWQYPNTIPFALEAIGFQLTPTIERFLTIPINPPAAFFIGFFADTVVAFIPRLKNQLPIIEFRRVTTTEKKTIVSEKRSVETLTSPDGVEEPKSGPVVSTEISVKEVKSGDADKPKEDL